MKKLTKSQLSTIGKRLESLFNQATETEITDGREWYPAANDFCRKFAKDLHYPHDIVAGVISALSPRNKWTQNLKDTQTVLQAVRLGYAPEAVRVSTFHVNKFKAFEIARGNLQITRDSRKTFSFVKNVGSLDIDRVTIDIWHLRACFGRTIRDSVGLIAYDQLERLTLRKAEALGLKGYEFQAIVWLVCQRTFKGDK